jgi:hypothetical protein
VKYYSFIIFLTLLYGCGGGGGGSSEGSSQAPQNLIPYCSSNSDREVQKGSRILKIDDNTSVKILHYPTKIRACLNHGRAVIIK